MMPPGALLAIHLVTGVAGARPEARLEAEERCPGTRIEADASFRRRWPELVDRLQGELDARSDLDDCARVELRLEGTQVLTVLVTLPDGRGTSRSVTRSEDVLPVLQALLLVPERPPPAPTPLPPKPRADSPSRALVVGAEPPAADHPEATSPPRLFGLELSLITGARVGDGQVGVGAGALSFLEIHGWLLGFGGRADSYRALVGGDPEGALTLAALGGRRFDFGSAALDLTAGPAVAMKGLAFSQTESFEVHRAQDGSPPPPPPRNSEPSSGPVPRLLLGARVGFSPRSVFRTFVGLDAELGPSRASTDPGGATTGLPSFSLGLSVGATVGTR